MFKGLSLVGIKEMLTVDAQGKSQGKSRVRVFGQPLLVSGWPEDSWPITQCAISDLFPLLIIVKII